ncbi:TPA: Dam family site-specific DNA-(adenine-N6)-methyltransferase [Providencia rettgeri]|nr:Dam family site-specific DNA-(adenine-N6)-methyltransferase [Providencia rettgeri]
MANRTILKWAGSKVRIIEQLRPHLPKAKRLVEPFAGSCAIMMNADYEEYFIADINKDLINLYEWILNHFNYIPEDKNKLNEFNQWWSSINSKDNYYLARNIFNKTTSQEEKAIGFLVLNRHCYNGLCRYNSKGEFNVPYGQYLKPYFPKKEIFEFVQKAKKARIVNLEWQDTLSLVDYGDGVYCDPPYMGDNFTRYHATDFTDAEHESLAFALKDLNDIQGNAITVSNSIEAKALYADLGFTVHEIEAPRTIAANGSRKKACEIIAVLQ